MNKLLLLVLFPLLSFAFPATNLPTFIVADSFQPMTGANLNASLDNQVLVVTNGMARFDVTFNTEPTQSPRGCFWFFGGSVNTVVLPESSTYPTNSNTDGYFSYTMYGPAPELPEGTRIYFRKQMYFGGPPDSGLGLDCSGIAVYDPDTGLIWLPKSNCVHRLMDSDGNAVSETFRGGFNAVAPAMSLMSTPTE